MGDAWPTELRFCRGERCLTLSFDDGVSGDIPFELLRVESPSADVQGHGGAQKTLVLNKSSVGVTRAEPVGRYAVRIVFDDGHDSGLFTWTYLRTLLDERDARLAAYHAAVANRMGAVPDDH